MRSSCTASTMVPTVLWSLLLFFLFAAPMLMAARDGGGDMHDADGRTAELIRQHREAVSPFCSVPDSPGPPAHSLGGKQQREGRGIAEEIIDKWSFVREARPEIEPMIRPGNRAKRIRV